MMNHKAVCKNCIKAVESEERGFRCAAKPVWMFLTAEKAGWHFCGMGSWWVKPPRGSFGIARIVDFKHIIPGDNIVERSQSPGLFAQQTGESHKEKEKK